jgi:hypothetical protein
MALHDELIFYSAPFAETILSNLVSVTVNDTAFDFKYEKAEGNFVNLHVSCSFGLDTPSLASFSSCQLSELVNLVLDDRYVKDLSELGGILHFAEGSFRHRSCPEFHAHFNVCKFELTKAAVFPDFNNSGLLMALNHCFKYIPSNVSFELMPYEIDDETDVDDLSSLIDGLKISTSESKVRTPFETCISDCLNVRQRHEDGKPLGIYTIRRLWDALHVDFYEGSNTSSAIWYPWKTRFYNNCPGQWFQLPCPSKNSKYFYLFGFPDSKAKLIFTKLEKQLKRPLTLADKAKLPEAKYLRVDLVTNFLTVTTTRPEERFYQNGLDGLLCVEVSSTISLKSAIDLPVNQVSTSVPKNKLMLLKCPAVMRKDLDNVLVKDNPYFDQDCKGITNATNEGCSVMTSNVDLGPLLFHPFLPIVGFLVSPENASCENKQSPEGLCLDVLKRIQIFLRTLEIDTRKDGCEVVLGLHPLRTIDGPTRTFGTSVYSKAGEYTSTSIPGNLGGRWKSVVAYCWLQPSSYYTSSIVTNGLKLNAIADNRLTREEWLCDYKKFGRKYKVL